MDSLLQLAERCEAAEGPDRELGREVLRACGWTQSAHGHFLGPLTGWTSPDRAIYFDDDDFVRCKHDPTASLDAAMMLVPEGWIVDLCIRLGMEQHECKLHEWPQPCRKTPLVNAATPALALCAAALRARHSQGVSDNG